jgi:DNA-binding transcriptional regulator YbjK
MEKPPKPAADAADEVAYRGRRTLRAGAEQRRRAILEAALRLIVREGVRAVRHRAVAKEAGVPLSATTYYFRDIDELIADTFTLFVENGMAQVIDPAWVSIYQLVGQYSNEQLRDRAVRAALAPQLANLAADFATRELTEHRDHLLAEQAFLQAAILDPHLREPARLFRERILAGLEQFCARLGSASPRLDAELIHQTFLQLEYEHLLREPGDIDRARLVEVLGHRLRLVMGVQ